MYMYMYKKIDRYAVHIFIYRLLQSKYLSLENPWSLSIALDQYNAVHILSIDDYSPNFYP